MPVNHTDIDQWATVVKPSNGDPVEQAAWRDADEPLADRTFYLAQRLAGAEAGDIVRARSHALVTNAFAVSATDQPLWQQTSTPASPAAIFEVAAPKKGVIVAATMIISPASGHAGMPGTLPSIGLRRRQQSALGAPDILGNQTDPSGGLGAYETVHSVTLSGLSVPIEKLDRYFLRIGGEEGANSITGLLLLDAYLFIDPS
jgi:hypothetical protein